MLLALGFVVWEVYYFYLKVIFKKKEKYLWSPSQGTSPKWTEAFKSIFHLKKKEEEEEGKIQ